MPVFADLDQRWRLLLPAGTVVVSVDSRAEAVRQVRELPVATTVALVGGRRLRRLARRGRLRVLAEYVALPSLAQPVAITQRTPQTLYWTTHTVLTVPSGITRLHAPAWWAIRMVRALPRLMALAPAGDRLLVGTRS